VPIAHARPWPQFARFATVGASGYVVNLATFAAVHAAGAHYRVAATAAFGAAVTSNFLANRHWTFAAAHGPRVHQALRFLVVSIAAFLLGLGVLSLLIELTGLPQLAAQAVAIVVATPLSFLGNRLWTFRPAGPPRTSPQSPARPPR
jgi:dolichol-phosphate mannosyltransferase